MENRSTNPIVFILQQSRSVKFWAIAAFCFVMTAKTLGSLQHYLFKFITDYIARDIQLGQGVSQELWYLVLAFPCLQLVTRAAWRGSGLCGMKWLTNVEANTYNTLYSHLTLHSSNYFGKRYAGALANKISNAAGGSVDFLADALWQFLPVVTAVVVNTFLAYLASPILAVLFVVWVIVFGFINYHLVLRLYPKSYLVAESSSELKGRLVDTTTNMPAVIQGGRNKYEQEYALKYVEVYRKAHQGSWLYTEWILALNSILLFLFMGIMLLSSIYLLDDAALTIGTVVMIVSIVNNVQEWLFFLGLHCSRAIKTFGQINEGLEEILLPHDITDVPNAADLVVEAGQVSFESVCFSYDEIDVFKEFSLKIPAGQKLGIVGASGVGKTTLVSLLLRQYDLQSGTISIDNTDIKTVSQQSLRESIAVVPQDASLFHRTLKENIAYGNLLATDQEVYDAAKKAQASEFIESLADSFETYVGERGIKLSGGQRQRIVLARAFLKNAPILVLDEATSALDSESEIAVQLALKNLFAGRTVIAIAHRLSTLREMDRLVVIDQGQIVEDGTHSKLLEQAGIYAKLWNNQAGGFIASEA